MSIQELKLDQESANLNLRFDGYTVYYKPRTKNPTKGGGTAVLVKSIIPNSELTSLDNQLDNVGRKIEIKEILFYLISLYASTDTPKFETVRAYSKLDPNLLLLGDLNAKTPTVGCKTFDPKNGSVLDEILSSNLDLILLNDQSPTYFQFKSDYTEKLDLILCSALLANKVSSFNVLSNYKMTSDHAPIQCILKMKKNFRLESIIREPRFNFNKADWSLFSKNLDSLIEEDCLRETIEIDEMDKIFTSFLANAAESSIPKFNNIHLKSYPGHILELIKSRRESRKAKNKKGLSKLSRQNLSTVYNKLSFLIKNSIKA